MTSVRDSTPHPEDMEPQQTRVAALRARRQIAYLMLLTVLTGLLAAGISICYARSAAEKTEHKAREDIQRWCTLLLNLDDRYQKFESPPAGAAPEAKKQYADAVVFQKQIHDLVEAYDCQRVVR
jgi:hypothetical protein